MRHVSLLATAVLMSMVLGCQQKAVQVETDEQKTLYSLGAMLASNLHQFQLTAEELQIVKAGLTDGVMKTTPKAQPAQFQSKIQTLLQNRMAKASENEKTLSEDFLTQSATETGAQKFDSGLIMTETSAGNGSTPKATDTVTVHYEGTLRDGTVFDSSFQRGEPARFALNQVIPCWTEALQKMKVGGKSKIVCPSQIAYGDRGAPPKILPGAALTFNVELLDIAKK